MIRAKYIIDEIFANAGYSYESTFFDTDLFKQIYVSAFGNNANISIEIEQSTALSFYAYDNFNQGSGNLTLTQTFQNPGGNFSPYQSSPYFGSTFSVTSSSTATAVRCCITYLTLMLIMKVMMRIQMALDIQ